MFCSQLDEQLFIVLEHCILGRFVVQSYPVTILSLRSNVGVLFFYDLFSFPLSIYHFIWGSWILFEIVGRKLIRFRFRVAE